ncbi:MAG: DNA polymerase III subunit delta [Candidatus Wildermuthbacteria bacterium]|nr:DNA polymerase III subunit delta [Candidatus Wildermuthbacteria bacterium]
MLIFLYGQDTFRSRAKVKELVAQYQKVNTRAHNMRVFDCKEAKAGQIEAELKSSSLFAEKKFFLLKDPFANQALSSFFVAEKKRLQKTDDVLLFWQQDQFAKSSDLYAFLKKYATCQECAPLPYASLKRWAQGEFTKRKTAIQSQALELLLQSTGNDLWLLSNEISKLCLYAEGNAVSKADVQALVWGTVQSDIFLTIDAVASAQKKQALGLLSKHIAQGEAPVYLLSMIAYQFRTLLEIKDCAERKVSLSSLALHPFVVKKGHAQAMRFSLEQLKHIYRKIAQTDREMKTGAIAPEIGVSLLVSQL